MLAYPCTTSKEMVRESMHWAFRRIKIEQWPTRGLSYNERGTVLPHSLL